MLHLERVGDGDVYLLLTGASAGPPSLCLAKMESNFPSATNYCRTGKTKRPRKQTCQFCSISSLSPAAFSEVMRGKGDRGTQNGDLHKHAHPATSAALFAHVFDLKHKA